MLMATSASASTITGPYVVGGAGANVTQTQHGMPASGKNFDLQHKAGFEGFGGAGYGFKNNIRVEIEGDFMRNYATHSESGKSDQYGGFASVFYDIDLKKHFSIDVPVTPYVGVSAGYLWDNYNVKGIHNVSGTQGSFAYSGQVGARFDTGVNGLYVNTEYRMVGETESKDHYQTENTRFDNKFDHQFIVSVMYAFNDAPPPPAPVPTEIPAPAVARTYLIFFDWDKSDLTQQAKLIVGHAAQAVNSVGTTNINVSGYTDNSMAHVGSKSGEAYNVKLSIARANAVKAELIKDGVQASSIEVQGLGDNYQFVKTAPNTREALNRRVVITLR